MFLEAYHLGIFTEGAGETAQKLRALAALSGGCLPKAGGTAMGYFGDREA